ncbi:hypothetical protein [Solitalea koreensis]|uniref:Uncharacterized protein n=1 Tax=Solitalea koreensis TaxID=543615 RepID=A0A521E7A2_9SPHI|nr:hypothetical protein [Solitalea koreensis]SMO79823.1 hypothetical protein SAMN06265350_11216 [Solitalea koreensis]
MPKIYKERAILIGSFLGGPIAAGYLLAQNFSTFHQPKKERITWIISALLTILLLWATLTFEFMQQLPYGLLPLLYCVIAFAIVFVFQSKNIGQHLMAQGGTYSNRQAMLIGVLAAIFTVGTMALTGFVADVKTERQTFGMLNHEILYQKAKIADDEVKQMGLLLTKENFFDTIHLKSIYLEKQESKFILYIPVLNKAWNNADMLYYFQDLKRSLQSQYPNNKIEIKLCDTDIQQVMKVIE